MNKKLGIALAIMSIISMIASYFGVLAVPIVAVSVIWGILISVLIMLRVYYFQGYDSNPGCFWFTYSAISGTIMVGVIYATGIYMISDQMSMIVLTGLFPTILPVIGMFFGDIGRILIKNEPSII